jgi:hypothetical protein
MGMPDGGLPFREYMPYSSEQDIIQAKIYA